MSILYKNKYILSIICIVLIISMLFIVKYTFADDSTTPVKVNDNDSLIYYINVSYDGIDSYGNNSITSNGYYNYNKLNSDYIFVEDKIPDGLIFDGFVTTEDGSIGAYLIQGTLIDLVNNTGSYIYSSCAGNIYDDSLEDLYDTGTWNNDHTEYTYHGVHYNATTRTVSFIAENIQAGCQFSVGVKTKVPTLSDFSNVDRIDFYNYAKAHENQMSSFSNVVHNYLGNDSSTQYNVTYKYSGLPSSSDAKLPPNTKYSPNTSVGLSMPDYVSGYKFVRWESSDVTINNNSFTMPSNDVEITGVYEEASKYSVKYVIDGFVPDGYYIPKERQYYAYDSVTFDKLEPGDIVNGYRFLGWETTDVDVISENLVDTSTSIKDKYISSKRFIMPEKNVTFTGRFEKAKYKLIYKFNDSVLPPDYLNYLPLAEEYYSGDDVTLANVADVTGYKFLGWNRENTFKMPEEDVIVYGSWKEFLGYLEPELSMEFAGSREYFQPGEQVVLSGAITNTSDVSIKNVYIEEYSNTEYTGKSYTYTNEILPGETAYFTYTYELANSHTYRDTDYPSLFDVGFKIKYATAVDDYLPNNIINYSSLYDFKESDDYTTVLVKISPKLEVCQEIDGTDVGNIFQYQIYGESGYKSGFFLEPNKCVYLYLEPGNYILSQITPQEYNIDKIEGKFTNKDEIFSMQYLNDSTVTFTNKFVKKNFLHSFGRVFNNLSKIYNDYNVIISDDELGIG